MSQQPPRVVGHRLGQLVADQPDGGRPGRPLGSGNWVQASDAAALAAVTASAACRGHEGDFFPAGGEKFEPPAWLVELCGSCPVRQACLDWAVTHREQGYWAGTTTQQRRRRG